jgi:hypothetical protein
VVVFLATGFLTVVLCAYTNVAVKSRVLLAAIFFMDDFFIERARCCGAGKNKV